LTFFLKKKDKTGNEVDCNFPSVGQTLCDDLHQLDVPHHHVCDSIYNVALTELENMDSNQYCKVKVKNTFIITDAQ